MPAPVEKSLSTSESEGNGVESPDDRHSEPVISLPLVEIRTGEEDEEEIIKIRAILHRYDITHHIWKAICIGAIKILRHKHNDTVRIVMRQDKTFQVRANHFIKCEMQMNMHHGSNKAFIWSVYADYGDEFCKTVILAIKFANPQDAELWKAKFTEAHEIVRKKCRLCTQDSSSTVKSNIVSSEALDILVSKLKKLKLDDD